MYNPQLETFLQVAEAGSFSKAAQTLFISPTAVIKQINLLEGSLGLELLERTHRGVALTEAGRSLYHDAKYIIQYSQDSLTRARNAMQSGGQVVRIGTSLITPSQFLVNLWPQLHKALPELKFQLVPFENTPENAREILWNLGQNIDLVAGVFDAGTLHQWGCAGLELSMEPLCCAVSLRHPLAGKERLTVRDLYGETLLLIRRGWNSYVDLLRDDLWEHHPQVKVTDFSFYDVNVFNQCESEQAALMTVPAWANVHPLLKIIPVDWRYTIPFGLLYAPEPSPLVQTLIQAVAQVYGLEK